MLVLFRTADEYRFALVLQLPTSGGLHRPDDKVPGNLMRGQNGEVVSESQEQDDHYTLAGESGTRGAVASADSRCRQGLR